RGRALAAEGGLFGPRRRDRIARRRWHPVLSEGGSAMSRITRRDFLSQSAAAVGAAAAGGLLARAAGQPRQLRSAADQVTLGRTGLKLSLLGMGTGSTGVKHSSNQVKLGQEGFTKLVRYAYDT